MPELPEVETVRRGLRGQVLDSEIRAVTLHHARATRRQPGGAEAFHSRLTGRRLIGAHRRGKYLWLSLDDPETLLVIHLGMSGQLRVVDEPVPDQHVRADLHLHDGRTLRFRDQRTFGWLLADDVVQPVHDSHEGVPISVDHVASDPFSADFRPDEVAGRMADSQSAVKRLLLDQRLVSGIGNIYADEALWRASVHPETPGHRLGEEGSRRVLDEAREVLSDALAAGGTSFDSLYVNVNGESGWFSRSLDVYGREGEPCGRCGTQITRARFMNRSSHLCPDCQPPTASA